MTRPLDMAEAAAVHQAAIEHCWQEEQLAHAEFYHARTAAQREELGAPEPYPWRGIMRTSVLRLIEALESAGLYDASKLTHPSARPRKLSIYRHSPYDYEIARHAEAMAAESKWGGPER